jgi:outer membrane protein OmpA-like peptidoglycan-associated protein
MEKNAYIRFIRAAIIAVLLVNFTNAQSHEDAAITGGVGMAAAGAPMAQKMNPAMLGLTRSPRDGLIVPILPAMWAGYWSDRLALTPYKKLLDIGNDSTILADYIDVMLDNSFGTGGLAPEESSKKIMEGVEDGVCIYAGTRITPLAVTVKRGALTFDTRVDARVNLPKGLFALLFGNEQGLVEGNNLDFKGLTAEAESYSTVSASYGQPLRGCDILRQSLNRLSRGFFDFSEGAWGVGLDYVLGHAYLREKTLDGSIKLTQRDGVDAAEIDGTAELVVAGGGLHGDWRGPGPFNGGDFFPGNGVGVNGGMAFRGPRTSLGLSVNNLGFIRWGDVKKVTYTVKDTAVQLGRLLNVNLFGGDSSSKRGSDSILDIMPGKNDTLRDAPAFFQSLPAGISLAASYLFDFAGRSTAQRALSQYTTVALQYDQNCAPWPTRSFIPRIALGAENGALFGVLPIRCGFFAGGAERYGSSLGLGINARYVKMDLGYVAYGTPYFYPKRGFAMAANIVGAWGYAPKLVPAVQPLDSDKDGIIDSLDKCPTVAEDKDGFQDADGCPDFDNDGDGINDTLDKCPAVAEDKDGFADTDGCPDFDNDVDNIPDSTDKCPNIPEDIDMFEDADGCPDYDNDKDGIPDSVDQCISIPETFNGFRDEDGCPDTLIKPTEKEIQVLNTKLRDINFKTASAELLPASNAALDFIVGFLKQYPDLRYEIQGHTDSRGEDDYNLLLSAARAATVRAYLLNKGIVDMNLIAIGYGETMPVADNKTAEGRAKNRRVEFKFIESLQDYRSLKAQEESFRQRIRDAKIQGAEY